MTLCLCHAISQKHRTLNIMKNTVINFFNFIKYEVVLLKCHIGWINELLEFMEFIPDVMTMHWGWCYQVAISTLKVCLIFVTQVRVILEKFFELVPHWRKLPLQIREHPNSTTCMHDEHPLGFKIADIPDLAIDVDLFMELYLADQISILMIRIHD